MASANRRVCSSSGGKCVPRSEMRSSTAALGPKTDKGAAAGAFLELLVEVVLVLELLPPPPLLLLPLPLLLLMCLLAVEEVLGNVWG